MALLKKRKAKMINMDRNDIDENYRYKFEAVAVLKEGKNKGKRTVIPNILSITKDIIGTKMGDNDNNNDEKDVTNKTAKHIARFIGQKVSSRCQFNKARAAIIISGEQSQATLQDVVFEYVEEFTFCPKCNRPELSPAVLSEIRCPACGYQRTNKKNGKKAKKERKTEKRDKLKRKKSKRNAQQSNDKGKDNDNDNAEDKEELKQQDAENEIQQKIAKDPMFSLYHFLKQREDVSIDEINERIKLLKLAHSLERSEEIKMIIHVLMEFDKDYEALNASIKKYKQIFEIFTSQNDDGKIFLKVMEKMIVPREKLLTHSYSIFYCLYDEEVLDEDEILEWYETQTIDEDAKLIRKKVQSFIDWLKEAEDDD